MVALPSPSSGVRAPDGVLVTCRQGRIVRELALSAAAASIFALGVDVAPAASAIEMYDPCMPHSA